MLCLLLLLLLLLLLVVTHIAIMHAKLLLMPSRWCRFKDGISQQACVDMRL
jgi:hypothetical protein